MLDKIGTTDDSLSTMDLFRKSISSSTVEFLSGLKPEPIIPEHPVIFKVLRLSLALIRVKKEASQPSVIFEAASFSSKPKSSS